MRHYTCFHIMVCLQAGTPHGHSTRYPRVCRPWELQMRNSDLRQRSKERLRGTGAGGGVGSEPEPGPGLVSGVYEVSHVNSALF